MIFYYSIYTFIILFSLFHNKALKKYAYFFSMLVLFVLSFLRWELGGDWGTYSTIFETSKNGLYPYIESGFGFLNYEIRQITDNYTVCLFVESLIIFNCFYFIFRKLSINPLISLIAFFALNRGYITYVRQDIAISFCMITIYALFNGKRLLAVLFLLLAFSIHKASIIVLPFFFFYNRKITFKMFFLLFLLSLSLPLCMTYLLPLLGGSKLSIIMRAVAYAENGSEMFGYGGGLSKTFIIFRSSLSRTLILVLAFLCRKKNLDDRKYNLFFNMYIISYCLFWAFAPISLTLSRFVNFYTPSEFFLYPYFLRFAKSKNNKFIIFFILIAYLALRIYSGISAYMELLVPYKSIIF